MDKNATQYGEQVMELGKAFAEEAAGAWQRYARMATHFQKGITPKQVGQGIKKFWQEDSPAYVREMIQLQGDYYLKALKLGIDYNRQFLETIFDPSSEASQPQTNDTTALTTESAKPPAQIQPAVSGTMDITFEGKAGEKLLQPFVVANHEARAIKVSFELSEFVCQDGTTIADVDVGFNPASFSIASKEHKIVECSVIPDNRFQTDKQYIAMARVVGFPDMLVRLILDMKST